MELCLPPIWFLVAYSSKEWQTSDDRTTFQFRTCKRLVVSLCACYRWTTWDCKWLASSRHPYRRDFCYQRSGKSCFNILPCPRILYISHFLRITGLTCRRGVYSTMKRELDFAKTAHDVHKTLKDCNQWAWSNSGGKRWRPLQFFSASDHLEFATMDFAWLLVQEFRPQPIHIEDNGSIL